jgi:dihydroxyacetone kinase
VSAEAVRAALQASLRACQDHEVELGELDSVAGDGDHGSGMVRGFSAACEAVVSADGTAGAAINSAGAAFADAAGGASGALWGLLLQTVGRDLDGADVTPDQLVAALRHGASELGRIGKAGVGDKTLLDTLIPFVDALDRRLAPGVPLASAWGDALAVARDATEATATMVARRGRAAALGQRGLGTMDPGARSLFIVLEATGDVIADATREIES